MVLYEVMKQLFKGKIFSNCILAFGVLIASFSTPLKAQPPIPQNTLIERELCVMFTPENRKVLSVIMWRLRVAVIFLEFISSRTIY